MLDDVSMSSFCFIVRFSLRKWVFYLGDQVHQRPRHVDCDGSQTYGESGRRDHSRSYRDYMIIRLVDSEMALFL